MPDDAVTTIVSVAILALPILAAWSVLRSVWSERLDRVLLVGLAIPVGLGASALLFLASLAVLGRPLSVGVDVGFWSVIAFGSWAAGTRGRELKSAVRPGHRASMAARLVLVVALAAAFAGFVAQQVRAPEGGSDAVAIWNLHARILVLSPGGWKDYLSSHANGFHVDYPLLVPSAVARVWSSTGGAGPAPSLVAGAFLLGTVCLLFGAVRVLQGESTAVFCTTVLVCSVYFVRTSAFQFADAPFACFLLGTMATTALALRSEDSCSTPGFVLAGLLAGCAAFTKNEGLLLLAVFGAVWAVRCLATVVGRAGLRDVSAATMALAVGLFPGVLCALWYKWSVAPPSEMVGGGPSTLAQLTDVSRFAVVGRGYVREWIALTEVGGLVLVAHVVARRGRGDWRANPVVWMGAAVVLLQLGGYFAVYLTTPYDLEWHVGASLRRLYVHVWPTCLLLFGIVFPSENSALRARSTSEDVVESTTSKRAA